MLSIDTKLAGAGLGTAIATVGWTVATWFDGPIKDAAIENPTNFATVVGASALIVGGLIGYFTNNTTA
jgi:hypothetical protein